MEKVSAILSKDEIFNKIREIIFDMFDIDSESIKLSSPFKDGEIPADSLDFIDIIVKVERKFNVVFNDSEEENINVSNVETMVDLVHKKLSEK